MDETMEWQGVTQKNVYSVDINNHLANITELSKRSNWQGLFDILKDESKYVNFFNPSEDLWYAPLHYAAEEGASDIIIRKLIEMGSWRTLRTAKGERAVDIVARKGHTNLVDILKPVLHYSIATDRLAQMQKYFHKYIIRRTETLVKDYKLRLPDLEPLLEMRNSKIWFPVPGMMGGFSYWIEEKEDGFKLLCNNWSRMDGTIYHYEISSDGTETESIDEE